MIVGGTLLYFWRQVGIVGILFGLFFAGTGVFVHIHFILHKLKPIKKAPAKLVSIDKGSEYMEYAGRVLYVLKFEDEYGKYCYYPLNDVDGYEEGRFYEITKKDTKVLEVGNVINHSMPFSMREVSAKKTGYMSGIHLPMGQGGKLEKLEVPFMLVIIWFIQIVLLTMPIGIILSINSIITVIIAIPFSTPAFMVARILYTDYKIKKDEHWNLFTPTLLQSNVVPFVAVVIAIGAGVLLFSNIPTGSGGAVNAPRIQIVSPAREVPFQAVGNFTPQQFHSIMAQHASSDSIILVEIYEESLIALLNDPTVSPLQRAQNENFLVLHYNPIALHLIEPDMLWDRTLRVGHGRGDILISQEHLHLVNREDLARMLREHAQNYNILDMQFIIFDDPHLRYEPAQFVWFETEENTFIVWITNNGANAVTYFARTFASQWQDHFILLP